MKKIKENKYNLGYKMIENLIFVKKKYRILVYKKLKTRNFNN
jgi:hypothetical protein